MQVLVHLLVFERILSCLLRRSGASIQVFQLRAEAHAYLEGVGHRVVGMEVPQVENVQPCLTSFTHGCYVGWFLGLDTSRYSRRPSGTSQRGELPTRCARGRRDSRVVVVEMAAGRVGQTYLEVGT